MTTLVNKPTPQDFINALVQNWASLVSGGLSVPFTVFSIYTNNPNAKLISGLLAVVGVIVASYSLWARERDERIKTQGELERQTAKLGRPLVTLGVKSDNLGRFWVCMMNYSDRPAVNVRADDIVCGDKVLRTGGRRVAYRSEFGCRIRRVCVCGFRASFIAIPIRKAKQLPLLSVYSSGSPVWRAIASRVVSRRRISSCQANASLASAAPLVVRG